MIGGERAWKQFRAFFIFTKPCHNIERALIYEVNNLDPFVVLLPVSRSSKRLNKQS